MIEHEDGGGHLTRFERRVRANESLSSDSKPDESKTGRAAALFSAKAEYACVAHAGAGRPPRRPDSRCGSKAIADKHGISQRFLVQILLQLKAAGLVASTRGAAGGYQLARPPERDHRWPTSST